MINFWTNKKQSVTKNKGEGKGLLTTNDKMKMIK